MLPARLKNWLEKKRGYLRLRYSPGMLRLWLLLRPAVRAELRAQRELYLPLIKEYAPNGGTIFDIGANEGFLTGLFLEAGYSVVAVEPDRRNFLILQERFRHHPKVKLVQAAATDMPGRIGFFESNRGTAFGTLSVKWKNLRQQKRPQESLYAEETFIVDATTIDQLIDQFGVPAFIKIDVEGYEETVLRCLTQAVPLLSFEAILPEFREETESCVEQLERVRGGAEFGFSVANRFQSGFLSRAELVARLRALKPQTVEIFCRYP